ncbi:LuxR C-terminal-related transcriptional regulator [Cohnella faecalis]|nr:LuxR family transcriptional regulator [Cohnella faecalis]
MSERFIYDAINRLEEHYFVGRTEQTERFVSFLRESGSSEIILNVYGTGGVGKSYLLREFARIAAAQGRIVCQLDARTFRHTPEAFIAAVMTSLQQPASNEVSADFPEAVALHNCLNIMNILADRHRFVLFLDEYATMRGLDGWLQDAFFRGLQPNVRIVVAGRTPLDGSWVSSPAWRRFIASMPLEQFSKHDVSEYLARNDIVDEAAIEKAWVVSGGHPLYLSLTVPLLSRCPDLASLPFVELNSELVKHWLKETTTEEMRSLIEYMSIPRTFNQELLGYMRGFPVTDVEFASITRLSFVKASARGWVMQDRIRETIHSEFKKRMPKQYQGGLIRCANYWYALIHRRASSVHSAADIRDYICCVSDSMVRSVFQHSGINSKNRLETMDRRNFHEVKRYLNKRKFQAKTKQAYYVDNQKQQTYTFHMDPRQDEKRAVLARPEDWLALELDSVKLLRNDTGSMIGLVAAIPINRSTLNYLSEQPVTSSFFRALSEEDRSALAAPRHTQAGWVLRMLDVEDGNDSEARSELLNYWLEYLQYGNLLLVSTPDSFYRKLLLALGFREADVPAHYDYGENTPAPTYMLDLRKDRFLSYLHGMSHMAGIPLSVPNIALSGRESEIASLVLQGLTNNEIGKSLYLSEITIKKHVSNIFRKTGTKNRSQLIRSLMEISPP